jgi:thiol-disulfide isomerase/thioredoxin
MKSPTFLAGMIFLAMNVNAQSPGSTMMKSSGPSGDSSTMKSTGSTMMRAAPSIVSGFDLSGLGPKVVAFTSEKDAWTLAKSKTVVYFFTAGWCPTCQDAYKNIKADFRSLPEDFVLVFVDFDKAKDLRTKYSVSYQHTFVSIGPAGEEKSTWAGSRTIAEIVRGAAAL